MYSVQVLYSSVDYFECINYLDYSGIGRYFYVLKLHGKADKYAIKLRNDSRVIESNVSYVDALRKMFSLQSCLPNLLDNGGTIPCTPVQCHGLDLFRVWVAGGAVYVEVKNREDRRRYAKLDTGDVYWRLRNPEVWYGFYAKRVGDVVRSMNLVIVFQESGSQRASKRLQFTVDDDGIRPAVKGDGFLGRYKTLEELVMGV